MSLLFFLDSFAFPASMLSLTQLSFIFKFSQVLCSSWEFLPTGMVLAGTHLSFRTQRLLRNLPPAPLGF